MPTILAVNNDAPQIARKLLEAAGDQPDRVQLVTGGKYLGFSVDDELARKAGFVIDEQGSTPVVGDGPAENPESASEADAEAKKAPAKRTPRTAK
ncbi:hypothetical protein IU459_11820 [Nocardia amamiensis]|uniref:Uncharacterized protein n=1 Tax=Nocardia amamiensis TaxID=404578 RepID=A0ABS0CTZ0_9NOCA|nr:hypothetical protein [Nocardia amamiensis]MBF6298228.1 hypothetical protein [Nocardia amamiensis]